MRIAWFRIVVAIAAGLLLFSACKSSKGVSGRMSIDYSKEHADPMGKELVDEARKWLGTPYRYGGSTRNGTDCSGLVMSLYRDVCAVKIPRTTREQKSYCTEVARNKTRIGDLVFFGSGSGISHVGLYIGKGEMIHASSSKGVMVSNIDTGYWGNRYRGAGRVAGAGKSWAANAGKRKKRKSDVNSKVSKPVNPLEVPSSGSPLGVPSITLEEFAAMGSGNARSQKPTPASTTTPQTTVPQSVAPEKPEDVDPLDEIINEKIDSIFSTRFMD